MRRRSVDTGEIVRLYRDVGLRGQAIADRLGTTAATVYERLERAGIPRSRKARVPLDEAIRLYRDEGWSAICLAAKFGVDAVTVRSHLRNAGVPMRTNVDSRQPRDRRPCPRSLPVRGYFLGLVWGDFHVRCHGQSGKTISVMSSTTRAEQLQLCRETFGPFGKVTSWQERHVRASLDMSFAFLFDKYGWEVPAWVRGPEAEAAFAAGYVDAEGCFGVYEGRARFKLDSYDVSVLHWLHDWCQRIGVDAKLRRVARRGAKRSDGPAFRCDLWRVTVNAGPSILRFVATLEPYLRHARRVAGASAARSNVVERFRSRGGNRSSPMCSGAGAHRPRQDHPD